MKVADDMRTRDGASGTSAEGHRPSSGSLGIVLKPSGDLDDDACSTLRRAVSRALSAGVRHVVLDFSTVTRLEREAADLLHGLDRYLRAHHGGLVITVPSTAALRALKINDLANLLDIQDLAHPPGRSNVGTVQSLAACPRTARDGNEVRTVRSATS